MKPIKPMFKTEFRKILVDFLFVVVVSFFSNVTGLAACLICPERFYCEGAEGDSTTPIPCPRGHYCPAGTGKSPEKCPAGTYNPEVSTINSLGDFINDKIKFQH